jgi:hypothetical protein
MNERLANTIAIQLRAWTKVAALFCMGSPVGCSTPTKISTSIPVGAVFSMDQHLSQLDVGYAKVVSPPTTARLADADTGGHGSTVLPQIVPPSPTPGNPNDPVSTNLTGSEFAIADEMRPSITKELYVWIQNPIVADIRIVAIDGSKVVGVAWDRDSRNDSYFGVPLGIYSGQTLRWRAELCVNGKWQPITAPMKVAGVGRTWDPKKVEYDELRISFGSEVWKPIPGNVGLGLKFAWEAPKVTMNLVVEHNPLNLLVYQQANNKATVSMSLDGQPYSAKTISVRMAYKGNLVIGDPFPTGPGVNGSEGGPHPATPPTHYDSFPYGGPLTDTRHDSSFAEKENSLYSGGTPSAIGVTSGFTAEGAAVLMDGREYYISGQCGE